MIIGIGNREITRRNLHMTVHTISASNRWTIVGLAIALVSMPSVIGLFLLLRIPWHTSNVLLRELLLFALATTLLFIVRNGERQDWRSIGLQRPRAGNTALWVLITFIGVAVAGGLAFSLIKLLNLPFGSSEAAAYDALPTWLLSLVIVRAGFVEELFYRGYAIERLESLTSNRTLAVAIPLAVFSVGHYRQGWAGIIIALLTGAVLSGVYLRKRNLWITITAHFLGDFIPNIIVPLFAGQR